MKTEAEPLRMHSQAEPGNDLQTSNTEKQLEDIHSCDSWLKMCFHGEGIQNLHTIFDIIDNLSRCGSGPENFGNPGLLQGRNILVRDNAAT